MTEAQREAQQDNLPSSLTLFRSSLISPQQVRAGRGYLGWGRNELAEIARISPETIKNIEHGVFYPQPETLERLLSAFASHHIQFFNLNFLPPYIINGVMQVFMNERVTMGAPS